MPSAIAFTAPHHQATQAGMDILRKGGSAVDAMIAAAATIAVVYPHMNSWGGDGFWLIQRPGQPPQAIDACGYAAAAATPDWYEARGFSSIPARGPGAAVTMAGTVGGWQLARDIIAAEQPLLPLSEVFAEAIKLARQGIAVTASLQAASKKTFPELHLSQAFAQRFLPAARPLQAGETLTNPGLARLLEQLAEEGLESFYRGSVGRTLARALSAMGSPLALSDFVDYRAREVTPLQVETGRAKLFNLPAPTQGIASLLILALYDQLYEPDWCEAERVHHLVECTKQAFMIRNRYVTDPQHLPADWDSLLQPARIAALADEVDQASALPWPNLAKPGDTVWMGALDRDGTMVSFIQSVYWEFGSGVVIPEYGLVWNNRGTSFSLDSADTNFLRPRCKPFHTLNPAFALLKDGRRLSYGTMGGEGQPQTQAAVYSRFVYQGLSLADAIAKSRWLLGRTWGDTSHDLKLEESLMNEVGEYLAGLGHDLQTVPDNTELMGHAGAICLNPDGSVDVGTDPRSDGAALMELI